MVFPLTSGGMLAAMKQDQLNWKAVENKTLCHFLSFLSLFQSSALLNQSQVVFRSAGHNTCCNSRTGKGTGTAILA